MYNKCIVTGRKNDGLDRAVIKPSSQVFYSMSYLAPVLEPI